MRAGRVPEAGGVIMADQHQMSFAGKTCTERHRVLEVCQKDTDRFGRSMDKVSAFRVFAATGC